MGGWLDREGRAVCFGLLCVLASSTTGEWKQVMALPLSTPLPTVHPTVHPPGQLFFAGDSGAIVYCPPCPPYYMKHHHLFFFIGRTVEGWSRPVRIARPRVFVCEKGGTPRTVTNNAACIYFITVHPPPGQWWTGGGQGGGQAGPP